MVASKGLTIPYTFFYSGFEDMKAKGSDLVSQCGTEQLLWGCFSLSLANRPVWHSLLCLHDELNRMPTPAWVLMNYRSPFYCESQKVLPGAAILVAHTFFRESYVGRGASNHGCYFQKLCRHHFSYNQSFVVTGWTLCILISIFSSLFYKVATSDLAIFPESCRCMHGWCTSVVYNLHRCHKSPAQRSLHQCIRQLMVDPSSSFQEKVLSRQRTCQARPGTLTLKLSLRSPHLLCRIYKHDTASHSHFFHFSLLMKMNSVCIYNFLNLKSKLTHKESPQW
jgi:hypothetical protein